MKNIGISLIFIILVNSLIWGQHRPRKAIIEMEPVPSEHYQVSIAFTLKDIPGQRFILTIPETFTVAGYEKGMYTLRAQNWNIYPGGAEMQHEDEHYKYSIKLFVEKSQKKTSLKWQIVFENNSSESLKDLASFNCLNLKEAPLFKDLEMERTWVCNDQGEKVLLKTIPKTQAPGKRTMQFYPAVGGIKELSASGFIKQWGVTSAASLSGNSISIVSRDSEWIIENVSDGPVAYFFNNWESTHGCIHASPLLSKMLETGNCASASGSINFIKNRK